MNIILKFTLLFVSCLLIVLVFSACNRNTLNTTETIQILNTDSNISTSETNAEYADNSPKFLDVIAAKDNAKSLIFGSDGWFLEHIYNSSFIYARAGEFLFRYNINDNTIDRAITYMDMLNDGIVCIAASPNDNYAIIYNSPIPQTVDNDKPSNIYLLNFYNNEIKLLANDANDINVNMLPESLREDFDLKKLNWNTDTQDLNVLKYSIENDYDELVGSIWYAIDEFGEKREITHLRNSLNSPAYVVINSNTIATFIPNDDTQSGGLDLGYYKLVFIDLSNMEIIKEYSINEY